MRTLIVTNSKRSALLGSLAESHFGACLYWRPFWPNKHLNTLKKSRPARHQPNRAVWHTRMNCIEVSPDISHITDTLPINSWPHWGVLVVGVKPGAIRALVLESVLAGKKVLCETPMCILTAHRLVQSAWPGFAWFWRSRCLPDPCTFVDIIDGKRIEIVMTFDFENMSARRTRKGSWVVRVCRLNVGTCRTRSNIWRGLCSTSCSWGFKGSTPMQKRQKREILSQFGWDIGCISRHTRGTLNDSVFLVVRFFASTVFLRARCPEISRRSWSKMQNAGKVFFCVCFVCLRLHADPEQGWWGWWVNNLISLHHKQIFSSWAATIAKGDRWRLAAKQWASGGFKRDSNAGWGGGCLLPKWKDFCIVSWLSCTASKPVPKAGCFSRCLGRTGAPNS